MSENRCRRCNRVLKDPNAEYGWRCAEILGMSDDLNYAGDLAFDRFILGVSAAENIAAENGRVLTTEEMPALYEAMAKRYIAADMHNHILWKEAYDQSEAVLNGMPYNTVTPLSEYFELRDAYDHSNGGYTTTKYLDGAYSEDTKKLQHALNEMGYRDKFKRKLKEDGLFGPKTQWVNDIFSKGFTPILTYINPLQTQKTGVAVREATNNHNNYINPSNQLYDTKTGKTIFMLHQGDVPIFKDGVNKKIANHINVYSLDNATQRQLDFAKKYNHKEVSDLTYKLFKDFEKVTNIAKKGGKALSVLGYSFDAVDFGTTVYSDLNDSDKKLGKKTANSAVGIAGSWAGGAAGAKLGAMGGAAIGTMICPGIGTAIGGLVGGAALGAIGAWGGRELGEYAVDKTYEEFFDEKKR